MPPAFWLDTSVEISVLFNVLCHGKAQRRSVIHCRRKALQALLQMPLSQAKYMAMALLAPQGGWGYRAQLDTAGLSTAGCYTPCWWLLPRAQVSPGSCSYGLASTSLSPSLLHSQVVLLSSPYSSHLSATAHLWPRRQKPSAQSRELLMRTGANGGLE